MKFKKNLSIVLRVIVAIIFLQTLYFKFTGHPDSVHIFSELGIEPYGRIGVGVAELITAFLLLIPRTMILGMLSSLGIIVGAIFSHLMVLGISVSGDGGELFALALVVLICTVVLLLLHKADVIRFLRKIVSKPV